MNIIELAKEAGYDEQSETIPSFQQFIQRFAAIVLKAEADKTRARFAQPERPERGWVDLTCEEVTAQIREGAADGGWQGFATRIQNAFKEKNK